MRRFLVVGNQTLDSRELRVAVRDCLTLGPCRFHVLVPATPAAHHVAWTEGEATAVARRNLDDALAWMHGFGAVATGSVGDADPVLAVTDLLGHAEFDAIILSTLPAGVSRWIRQDLPHRLRRRTDLSVHHVVASTTPTRVYR